MEITGTVMVALAMAVPLVLSLEAMGRPRCHWVDYLLPLEI
jgi:hypothetical protein